MPTDFRRSITNVGARGIALMILPLLLVGCARVSRTSKPFPESSRDQIYRRAAAESRSVDLYKPRFPDSESEAFRLAPLFLIEAGGTGSSNFISPPEVLFFAATNLIGSQPLKQWTYLWKVKSARQGNPMQAVRITLNPAGHPSIWEVFSDPSGAEQIWISQAFEVAAALEFGAPLPGRRNSAEASIGTAPSAIVPGIVDDGPMPMGPVIYGVADGTIRNVACRCSAPQAESLEAQGYYELRPVAKAEVDSKVGRLHTETGGSWLETGRIERLLRVPGSF